MMPKKMIKIICIAMAALMILSVGAVIFQVIAADEAFYQTYAVPVTGDNDADYIIPVGIAMFALLAIGVCIFLPKFKKTDGKK